MQALEAPSARAIDEARARLAGTVVRTPLIRLDVDAPVEICLKLENLQPIGSFKLRGALNAIRARPAADLAEGVYTASAGNMAQGVAWAAREAGVSCTVLVPDHAPRAKLDAIARLGATTIPLPFAQWWQVLVDHGYPGMHGCFVHPAADADVIAGNATIGAEVLEDLHEIEAVYVPYGGGGLACGIAGAMALGDSRVRVHACEIETAAPLRASWDAGCPVTVERKPSFVDGVGGQSVLAEMWPLARSILAEPVVVRVADVADAVRLLLRRGRILAEGAGATPVAAALTRAHGWAKGPARVVCIVSGGNIDVGTLQSILANEL